MTLQNNPPRSGDDDDENNGQDRSNDGDSCGQTVPG